MKLKRLRQAKELSQDALARKARNVNTLEAGRYDPTVGVLTRLAKALNVPVTGLLE